MKLTGKVSLITGAARGLGLATARLFVEEGAAVICVDTADLAEKAFTAEHFGGSDKASYRRVDITKPAEVKGLAAFVEKAHGRLDILVNNAAVDTIGSVEETTEEEFRRIIDVNVFGTFCVTKNLMPLIRKAGPGSAIVNVASNIGLMGMNRRVAYTTSKGAVVNFTRSVAIDCAPLDIRVNAIAPGAINTEMVRKFFEGHADKGYRAEVESWHALNRFAEPVEIARGILFLASGDSSYATGMTLSVDGGYTAGKW
jgi:meso-butanediol dehydrogenase / (S,S)-butanediol dehydrogenase / diacetyl reductase